MVDSLFESEFYNDQLLKPFGQLFLLSFFFVAVRVFLNPQPVGDFSGVWQAQGQSILTGGVPYVDQWDNKTPLWTYLQTVIAATPNPFTSSLILLATVNALSAFLLGQVCAKIGVQQKTLITGSVYLVLLANFKGFTANPRQFATLFLLLALLDTRPIAIGVFTAIACLFHQYYGLLIPVILLFHWWFGEFENYIGSVAAFSASGLFTAVLTYLSLLIWGVESLRAGISYSVFGIVGFVNRGMATSDAIWRGPVDWFIHLTIPIRTSPAVLCIGILGLYGIWRYLQRCSTIPIWICCLVGMSSMPLLVDPAHYYLIAPSAGVAIAGSIGLQELFNPTVRSVQS